MNHAEIKRLFFEALERPSSERESWLATHCPTAETRHAVYELLEAHDRADTGDFLEQPAIELQALGAIREAVGTSVGPFRLVEPLGEGGFGVVWRARQNQPLQREVAVKIIKLGMDTAAVVARFEREREALEQLHHPNIARILDAGATTDGRPWFAMDLVEGAPITDWCDAQELDLKPRITLFCEVCRAVQHAHHKGIIHRDIKPSNVLVTEHDGDAAPRVIDFGIAKAIGKREAEHSRFTQGQELLGTPEYMSPEQATTWGEDVDARTDVYSLGVLLYQLLTGCRPFDRLHVAGGSREVLRLIREEEPSRPSTRLETSAHAAPIACGLTQRTLRQRLRGDLDWIVLKALHKDREHRYATPQELAADLQRHLSDEPITASRPGPIQRIRRLARRHRALLAVAVVTASSLVIGTALSLHGLVRARDAEHVARQSERRERDLRVRAQNERGVARAERDQALAAVQALEDLVGAADPFVTLRADYTVRELIDGFERDLATRAAREPAIEARLHAVIGRYYKRLGELTQAATHLEAAADLRRDTLGERHPDTLRSQSDLAWLRHDQGQPELAVVVQDRVIAELRQAESNPAPLVEALDAQAQFLGMSGRSADALATAEEGLALARGLWGENSARRAHLRSRRGQILAQIGRRAEAQTDLEEAERVLSAAVDQHDPNLASVRFNLAVLQSEAREFGAALASFRRVIESRTLVFGANYHGVARARAALAWLLHQKGDHSAAETELRSALTVQRESLGEDHAEVSESIQKLGAILTAGGDLQEAESLLVDAAERFATLAGHPPDGHVAALANLGGLRWEKQDYTGAEEALRAARTVAREKLSPESPVHLAVLVNLAYMRQQRNDLAEAEALLAESVAIAERALPPNHPQLELQRKRLAEVRRLRK